jgi:glycosyltransferase involved in cell wall biosynthesis
MDHGSTALMSAAPTRPRLPGAARPLRVCYLIDELARAGTESQLLALIEHLDRSRVEPLLCLLKGGSAVSRALEPRCCPVIRLGVESLYRPSALVQALWLARLLRRQQIDVLQVYFPDSTRFGVPVARLAGVPCVVRTRNNLGYSATRGQRWLGRLYNRLVDATIANCAACRAAVLDVEGPSPDTVVVLENGVDLARFDRAAHGRCDTAAPLVRVGMTANLRPVKRPELLVQAAAIIHRSRPDARFQIAGEGELRPRLQGLIDEHGLTDCFQLLGSSADVPAFLAEQDVAVLCSQSEGQSNALLEYMAAGRAIVATAVGGNVELIEPDVHGLLVPPDDAAALAGAILELLNDPSRAARLGNAARRRVEERYSLEARARRFEDFYESLRAQRQRRRVQPCSGS